MGIGKAMVSNEDILVISTHFEIAHNAHLTIIGRVVTSISEIKWTIFPTGDRHKNAFYNPIS